MGRHGKAKDPPNLTIACLSVGYIRVHVLRVNPYMGAFNVLSKPYTVGEIIPSKVFKSSYFTPIKMEPTRGAELHIGPILK